MKSHSIFFNRTGIYQPVQLRARRDWISNLQAKQGALFKQLDTLNIDAGLNISALCSLIKFGRTFHVATFAIEVAVSFQNLTAQRHQAKELATIDGAAQMWFASRELSAVEIAACHVQMRDGFLRHRRALVIGAQHAA